MAELKGTQVAAIVVPFTDADKYATHDAEYGKGGFRSVSTIEDRDAIPVERKTEGMIVRVTANGLNYEWKNNAWVEWLPKGNIVIDTALNETSTNPVQNKAITTRVHTIENKMALLSEYTHNIPIITVDTVWNATSDNPASSKAIESTISHIRTTANAAIPKSKIDTGIDGTETAHDAVPSVGAVVTYVKSQRTAIDGSINAVSGRVTTLETWKNGIGNKNQANGVAGLDASGKISASQLPAGYDNVDKLVAFVTTNPSSGMTIGQKWYNTTTKKIFTATSATSGSVSDPIGNDMIYIDQNANKSYYWTGTDMVNIGSGNALALGTTSSTAFRGDYGNTLYTNFGSGTNLTGTQSARDFFHNMSLFNSLENISILKNLVVQPEANFVRLQNDIVYLIGEVNTGDGYDIPAATTTKAGVMTADMFNLLQELEKATFPLTLTLGGAGTFEVGSSTSVPVNITAVKGGQDVTPNATIKVIAGGNHPGKLSPNKKSWTPSSPITAETRISVAAQYEGRSKTAEIYYRFKYKKYWGTSSKSTLTNSDILALGGSTWADSRTMGATTFDCTGGKYVYYVIPSSLGTPEFWVGGLKNTDVVTTSATVTNASGGSTTYQIMRLTNIQTGILSIQFK
jgi:hypothetical protein